jgi:hypothetical protein
MYKHDIQILSSEIVSAIETVSALLKSRNERSIRIWTTKVKEALIEVGKKRKFDSYTNNVSVETAWNEWLWDFVWAEGEEFRVITREEAAGTVRTIRLPMIAEIEWNTNWDEIALDFQKLAFGIADLKLYIFTKHLDKNQNKRIFDLCKEMCNIEGPAKVGHYLLIGVPRLIEDKNLFVETITY